MDEMGGVNGTNDDVDCPVGHGKVFFFAIMKHVIVPLEQNKFGYHIKIAVSRWKKKFDFFIQ